ncbi:MAG: GDP-L-fucose synthase [Elusimicrobia bacterium]|nr:GDP-L-fucose synthase [Elusimicrobiota bacterium]
MKKDSRIYVTGHTGLVGSALVRLLEKKGYRNLVLRSRRQLDLRDRRAVDRLFDSRRPEYVFHAAARVGGIAANSSLPGDFIYENLAMQTNVIDASRRRGVKRLIFFSSSCVYPKFAPLPIREDSLLTGPIEPTNEPYGIAKIAGLKMCESYNRQFGTDFLTLVPANLYGPGDHFDGGGHVISGLLQRFHEAKKAGAPEISIWGSGKPSRDFLYVDDLAEACLLAAASPRLPYDALNIGSGRETSIKSLALAIKGVVGYRGKVVFDTSRPDGMLRRYLDTQRGDALGWKPKVPLTVGLRRTYAWYRKTLAR